MDPVTSSFSTWFDRGSSVLILVIVVSLAVAVANFTWFILAGSPPEITSSERVLNDGAGDSTQVKVNVQRLKQWQLFGDAGAAPQPVQEERKSYVQTSLRLTLEGVFLADLKENSSAIIAEQGKPGLFYRVSDRVPGNAVLDKVEKGQVILDRNGRLEVLKFPDAGANAFAVKAKKKRQTTSRRTSGRKSRNITKGGPINAVDALFTQIDGVPTPEKVVAALTSEIRKDSGKFMKDMGVASVPMAQGGGYKVTKSAPPELIQAIGLKPDDVIQSINGQTLGNVTDDVTLIESFSQGECDLALDVKRGSSILTLNADVCSGALF